MDGNRELRMIRIRFKPNLGGTRFNFVIRDYEVEFENLG